jgi:hypothetical protein
MEPNRALETGEDSYLDSVLLDDWHVVAAATDIVPGNLVPGRQGSLPLSRLEL